MLNRDKPYVTQAGCRNWKYMQDGMLYDQNGIEVDASGNIVGEFIDNPAPVEEAVVGVTTIGRVEEGSGNLQEPDDMSDGELKDELKDKDISIKGGLNRTTLIARVIESRVES